MEKKKRSRKVDGKGKYSSCKFSATNVRVESGNEAGLEKWEGVETEGHSLVCSL